MRILVAGSGNIGIVVAKDLAESMRSDEVIVADKDGGLVKAAIKGLNLENISSMQLDVTNHRSLVKNLRNIDLVLGALPGRLGYGLAETCVEMQKNLVDVSYMAEDPLTLNRKASEAGVLLIPDCGLAPGISNLLVGHAAAELDTVKLVSIMVGGLPERPVPPLGYVITWSPESLIDEYTRKATIIENSNMVEVDALTGLEEIEFQGVGKLEAFYTDGLRTLIHTIEAEEMWEKTLRYPGHVEKLRTLLALGLFDTEPIRVDNSLVRPRALMARLLARTLKMPEIRDIVALSVRVSGISKGERREFLYQLLSRYDEKDNLTAMARTTAYPASIISQIVLKKTVRVSGVCPPEKIGQNIELYSKIMSELEKRGIIVSEKLAKLD